MATVTADGKKRLQKYAEYFREKVQQELESYAEENGFDLVEFEAEFLRRANARTFVAVYGGFPKT